MYDRNNESIRKKSPQMELNHRPKGLQPSALPLSYG